MDAARVLIVEDEPINLELLTELLGEAGYRTTAAATGEAAWAQLTTAPGRFDVVILDRLMPDMDGLDILLRIKGRAALAQTPVIMQTSLAGDGEVAEGLQAGAYYYLTKPFAADTLLAIVAAATRDRREYLALQREALQATRTLACLDRAEFVFRTTTEARDIATLLAGAAPDPGRVVVGLSELMINAVEHGNLGIGYEEKSRLIRNDRLAEELERRLASPAWAGRRARVEFQRGARELRFTVRDEGEGFAWREYLEMSPQRAFDLHGRGIAMARLLSFDRLQYLGGGNAVEAAVSL